MAERTFTASAVQQMASNAIAYYRRANEKTLKYRQDRCIELWKETWFSRLFRRNWTDKQFRAKALRHSCGSFYCELEYPTFTFVYNEQISKAVKIRNLAQSTKGADEVVLTEEEYLLLSIPK